jgi:hypothetical protein
MEGEQAVGHGHEGAREAQHAERRANLGRKVLLLAELGAARVAQGVIEGHEVDIPEAYRGQGRVILFSNNPICRWQNHGEFGMVFNSVLNWNDSGT